MAALKRLLYKLRCVCEVMAVLFPWPPLPRLPSPPTPPPSSFSPPSISSPSSFPSFFPTLLLLPLLPTSLLTLLLSSSSSSLLSTHHLSPFLFSRCFWGSTFIPLRAPVVTATPFHVNFPPGYSKYTRVDEDVWGTAPSATDEHSGHLEGW